MARPASRHLLAISLVLACSTQARAEQATEEQRLADQVQRLEQSLLGLDVDKIQAGHDAWSAAFDELLGNTPESRHEMQNGFNETKQGTELQTRIHAVALQVEETRARLEAFEAAAGQAPTEEQRLSVLRARVAHLQARVDGDHAMIDYQKGLGAFVRDSVTGWADTWIKRPFASFANEFAGPFLNKVRDSVVPEAISEAQSRVAEVSVTGDPSRLNPGVGKEAAKGWWKLSKVAIKAGLDTEMRALFARRLNELAAANGYDAIPQDVCFSFFDHFILAKAEDKAAKNEEMQNAFFGKCVKAMLKQELKEGAAGHAASEGARQAERQFLDELGREWARVMREQHQTLLGVTSEARKEEILAKTRDLLKRQMDARRSVYEGVVRKEISDAARKRLEEITSSPTKFTEGMSLLDSADLLVNDCAVPVLKVWMNGAVFEGIVEDELQKYHIIDEFVKRETNERMTAALLLEWYPRYEEICRYKNHWDLAVHVEGLEVPDPARVPFLVTLRYIVSGVSALSEMKLHWVLHPPKGDPIRQDLTAAFVDEYRQETGKARPARWEWELTEREVREPGTYRVEVTVDPNFEPLRGNPLAGPKLKGWTAQAAFPYGESDGGLAEALAAARTLLKLARDKEAETRTELRNAALGDQEATKRLDQAEKEIASWKSKLAGFPGIPDAMREVARLTDAFRPRIAELDAAYDTLAEASDASQDVEKRVKGFADRSPLASQDQIDDWRTRADRLIKDASRKIEEARRRVEALLASEAPLRSAAEKLAGSRVPAGAIDRAPVELDRTIALARDLARVAAEARSSARAALRSLRAYKAQIETLLRSHAGRTEADEVLGVARALGADLTEPGDSNVAGRVEEVQGRAGDLRSALLAARKDLGAADPAQVLAAAEQALSDFDDIRTAGEFAMRDPRIHIARALEWYGRIKYTPRDEAQQPAAPQQPEIAITSLQVNPSVLEEGKPVTVTLVWSVNGLTEATVAVHTELWLDVTGTGSAVPATADNTLEVGKSYTWTATWTVPSGARPGPVNAVAKIQAGGLSGTSKAQAVIKGVVITSVEVAPPTVKPGQQATVKAVWTVWGFAEASVTARQELWADVTGDGKAVPYVREDAVQPGVSYTGFASWTVPVGTRGGPMRATAKVTVGTCVANATASGTIEAAPAAPPENPPAAVEDALVGNWTGTAVIRHREGKKVKRDSVPIRVNVRRAGDGYIVKSLVDDDEVRASYATETTIGWRGPLGDRWDLTLTAPGEMGGSYRMELDGVTYEGSISLKRQ